MKIRAILSSGLSALAIAATSGCGGKAAESNTAATANIAAAQAASMPACAPGSTTLPITGLCDAQAAALVMAAPGAQPAAPDDCTWAIAETKVREGALLYRAAKCAKGVAKLEFVPGARMASFDLVASPYGDDIAKETIARILDGADGKPAILAEARRSVEDKAEAARCQVRPADMEGWPADALVVDEIPAPPADGIRSACGEFGLDEGAQTFWRLSQNMAWFFQLGQESPVVDATSFTLVNKGADGTWVRS